jgi:hypothetical protein
MLDLVKLGQTWSNLAELGQTCQIVYLTYVLSVLEHFKHVFEHTEQHTKLVEHDQTYVQTC